MTTVMMTGRRRRQIAGKLAESMGKGLDISVVVPLYNERESLPELVAWIDRVACENHLSYEIIMVDDGSRDGSWEEIVRLVSQYPAIKAIRFARNYGKSAALYCGFEAARGEVVFTMDADLQDPPELLGIARQALKRIPEAEPIRAEWKEDVCFVSVRIPHGIRTIEIRR